LGEKFELSVLWKFRGELITFGQQTQPAFMREPLQSSITLHDMNSSTEIKNGDPIKIDQISALVTPEGLRSRVFPIFGSIQA
jgi:hypothetical protein